MKKDESSIFTPAKTMKYFFVSFIGLAVAAIIIWPLMDLIFSAIFGDTFQYSVIGHIVAPIIFSLIVTGVEFLTWNVWHKEK